MDNVYYTYEFRIYPNNKQKILLEKHFGCVRKVYNHFLNERNQWYLKNKENKKKTLSYYDNSKALTLLKKDKNYSWLKEVNSQTLQYSLRCLDISFNRFFRGISKFPKFKSKCNRKSFHIPQHFSIKEDKLNIPKFRNPIKINIYRKIEGKILSITIKKNPSGKYFACIAVEKIIKKLNRSNNTIGIDLGLKNFLVDSNGNKISNPKFLKKFEKKLIYEQRQLSKKAKDSSNRNKQRIKVAKIHEKISNSRKDFLHKVSTKLINENQVICLESLQVKNMVKNHKLAKPISDAGWGLFTEMLKYKANWYGRTVSQINRFYPSSKLCFDCGYINSELTLEDRKWVCDNCKKIHDRDFNAAKNILRQGLNLVSVSGIDSDKKLMEASGLPESMKSEIINKL